jgi:hypothetical protein
LRRTTQFTEEYRSSMLEERMGCFCAKEAPPRGEAAQRPSSMPSTEGTTSTLPRIEMARVKPVDLTAPNFRLGNGRVALTEGFNLSSLRGIGGAWEMPDHKGFPLDAFDARYGRW